VLNCSKEQRAIIKTHHEWLHATPVWIARLPS
jgi:hypothetical protein